MNLSKKVSFVFFPFPLIHYLVTPNDNRKTMESFTIKVSEARKIFRVANSYLCLMKKYCLFRINTKEQNVFIWTFNRHHTFFQIVSHGADGKKKKVSNVFHLFLFYFIYLFSKLKSSSRQFLAKLHQYLGSNSCHVGGPQRSVSSFRRTRLLHLRKLAIAIHKLDGSTS